MRSEEIKYNVDTAVKLPPDFPNKDEIEKIIAGLDEETLRTFGKLTQLFWGSLIGHMVSKGYASLACGKCGNEHWDDWHVPSSWWSKIPEEYHDKSLCFDCYVGLLGGLK